jgi:antirestriction protein ArdC
LGGLAHHLIITAFSPQFLPNSPTDFGEDPKLKVPKRRSMSHDDVELEAESVAFLVCERHGISPKSENYLSHFVKTDTDVDSIDLYQIMRAAGHVETILKLTSHTKFNHQCKGVN